MGTLRGLVFYCGYTFVTIAWGTVSVVVAWALPFRARFSFIIGVWSRFVLFWLRLTCGINHTVTGLDRLPDSACIVLVQHQSTWETAMVQTLFAPSATLIKKELLHIPFFGWAFRLLRPIAIDRKASRKALKTLIDEGSARLEDGQWVVLFPEGTRRPVGEVGNFQMGGAALSRASGIPIVVVAHNAGQLWPAHVFQKYPGTIQAEISPPFYPEGKSTKEINLTCRNWLVETSRLLTNKSDAST